MTDRSPSDPQPILVQVQPRQTATWIIAIALSVIATAVVIRPDLPMLGAAFAQNHLTGSGGVHAFTGQLDKDHYGLFMMDTENGTVWVYEYTPLKRRLKLVCARNFTYDRYLLDFNNDDQTSPAQIEEMVKRQREARIKNDKARPSPVASPTPPVTGAARPVAPTPGNPPPTPAAGDDVDEVDADAIPDESESDSPHGVETPKDPTKNNQGQPR